MGRIFRSSPGCSNENDLVATIGSNIILVTILINLRETPKSVHASGIFYSLIETVQTNELAPYAYLRQIFNAFPYVDTVEKIEGKRKINDVVDFYAAF